MKRVTSIYTFHTGDAIALSAALTEAGHLISDRAHSAVSVRLPSDDDVAREVAQSVGHTGQITTGLGVHRRVV